VSNDESNDETMYDDVYAPMWISYDEWRRKYCTNAESEPNYANAESEPNYANAESEPDYANAKPKPNDANVSNDG
jgi:hypothetical protein